MGWLHTLDPHRSPPTRPSALKPQNEPPPAINCSRLIENWCRQTRLDQVLALSAQLQVSVQSLLALQVCWADEHQAWAIPMKDGYGNMVGIRLRAPSGAKWAVRGSHSGCFIPQQHPQPLALVAEGFSDTAAGLDLGFYTVGRPAASGGINELKHLFRRLRVRKAAIVCDNDKAGVTGAQMFSEHLGIPTCTIALPTKDLREFVQCGGDNQLMNTYVTTSIWSHVRQTH